MRQVRPKELSPALKAWVVENLLAGFSDARLIEELARGGVSRPLAARSVIELRSHPALDVAQRVTRQGRRLAQVQHLLTLQATLAAHPSAIERRPTPSADELFDRYLATSTPFIATDLVERWEAFGKWTPSFFKARFGTLPVFVTEDRESDPRYDANSQAHTRTTTLAAFVDRVLAAGLTNDFYMVARNKNISQAALEPLFQDIVLPSGWFEPDGLRGSSALWFGPAGTVTPLHHDCSSILFCQLYGRKRFRLASPLEITLLDGAHHMYSAVDPELADDPRVRAVTFKDFVLEAGEALFIPAGHWHHVRALDVSISLAINHFARPNSYDWYCPADVP